MAAPVFTVNCFGLFFRSLLEAIAAFKVVCNMMRTLEKQKVWGCSNVALCKGLILDRVSRSLTSACRVSGNAARHRFPQSQVPTC